MDNYKVVSFVYVPNKIVMQLIIILFLTEYLITPNHDTSKNNYYLPNQKT